MSSATSLHFTSYCEEFDDEIKEGDKMDALTVVEIIATIFILFHVAIFVWFFVKATRSGRIKFGAQYPYTESEEDFLARWNDDIHFSGRWDHDPRNVYYHTTDS